MVPGKSASREAGLPVGCLLTSISFTDNSLELFVSTDWSKCNNDLYHYSIIDSELMGFPLNISLANDCAKGASARLGFTFESLCCMVLPSSTKDFKSPCIHTSKRLFKQVMCSLTFDLQCGFCNTRIGKTVVAIKATDSKAEAEAKALNSLLNSSTKTLPTLPNGTLKQFFLQ